MSARMRVLLSARAIIVQRSRGPNGRPFFTIYPEALIGWPALPEQSGVQLDPMEARGVEAALGLLLRAENPDELDGRVLTAGELPDAVEMPELVGQSWPGDEPRGWRALLRKLLGRGGVRIW